MGGFSGPYEAWRPWQPSKNGVKRIASPNEGFGLEASLTPPRDAKYSQEKIFPDMPLAQKVAQGS